MLDELFDFEEIPKVAPKITKKNPACNQYIKYPLKYNFLENSKDETNKKNINVGTPTLGEKIIKRQKDEEDKKKKAEIYKELHQNKKMNLHQFLSRVQIFEQKRKYNLELKKYRQLQRETESMQEKPKLSSNTLKICQTMPKEPLYKRTNEIVEEHKNELKNLTSFYTLPREVREKNFKDKKNNHNKLTTNSNISKKFRQKYYSAENTKSSNFNEYNNSIQTYENIITINTKNSLQKKMTKNKSDEFFENQEKWLKNKRVRNQYFEKYTQIQNDTYSDITFKPYVSQATLEILDIKNRINTYNDEFYKYKIPYSYSQYNHYIINKGRTIWDKLYEESFQKKICLGELSIWENNNNNYNKMRKKKKFRNVSSKFFNIYLKKGNKQKNKRSHNSSFVYKQNKFKKGKAKKTNNSFDDKNKKNNLIYLDNDINSSTRNLWEKKDHKRQSFFMFNDDEEYNYYKMKKEKEKFHWRNSLLNIKPIYSEPNDFTYHLNIMQAGAWNVNYLNRITLNENSKCKSVINLVNTYE